MNFVDDFGYVASVQVASSQLSNVDTLGRSGCGVGRGEGVGLFCLHGLGGGSFCSYIANGQSFIQIFLLEMPFI